MELNGYGIGCLFAVISIILAPIFIGSLVSQCQDTKDAFGCSHKLEDQTLESEQNNSIEKLISEINRYVDLGDYEKAIIYTEELCTLDQSTDFKIFLANLYYSAGKKSKSFEFYENVIDEHPDNAIALNDYAYKLCTDRILLDQAEKLSRRAVELEPTNGNILDTYGWALFLNNKPVQAEEYLAKSINNGQRKNVEVLDHYAQVLFYNGAIEEALRQWQLCKKIDSNNLISNINEKISSCEQILVHN